MVKKLFIADARDPIYFSNTKDTISGCIGINCIELTVDYINVKEFTRIYFVQRSKPEYNENYFILDQKYVLYDLKDKYYFVYFGIKKGLYSLKDIIDILGDQFIKIKGSAITLGNNDTFMYFVNTNYYGLTPDSYYAKYENIVAEFKQNEKLNLYTLMGFMNFIGRYLVGGKTDTLKKQFKLINNGSLYESLFNPDSKLLKDNFNVYVVLDQLDVEASYYYDGNVINKKRIMKRLTFKPDVQSIYFGDTKCIEFNSNIEYLPLMKGEHEQLTFKFIDEHGNNLTFNSAIYLELSLI